MTKKIRLSIFAVSLVILLSGLVIITGSLYSYTNNLQQDILGTQLSLVVRAVENEGISYFDDFTSDDGYRFTLVNSDGVVLYDSETNSEDMENHAEREEISSALKTGNGRSIRYSSTMTERTIYLATRLTNGDVLRCSVKYQTLFSLILGMLPLLLLVVAAALILSVFLSSRLSEKIMAPLVSLDLEHPLDNDSAYEELTPVLRHIAQQCYMLEIQFEELKSTKREFDAIASKMNEGLVLLDRNCIALSINPAAMKIFNTDENGIGEDFLKLERHSVVSKCIDTALESGHSDALFETQGRTYQLLASRIDGDSEVQGLVLLAFDITEKTHMEQMRREFTANASHELKTPLQSIMGSAELIKSNMVKPEDMPRFTEHIYSEAKRLVALVNDTIRLSQLDEHVPVSKEDVNITKLVNEVISSVSDLARVNNITIKTDCDDITVHTVKQYIFEIISNLTENAVKYNKENGEVTLSVKPDGDMLTITVSDTGIGIPPEHHARIFERFYRVDKSHSKEAGGTGLGLSIVKNAVNYLGGTIELESKEGTTIKCTLHNAQFVR